MKNESQNVLLNLNQQLEEILENNMEKSVETINNETPINMKEDLKISIKKQSDEEINLTNQNINMNNHENLQKVEVVKIIEKLEIENMNKKNEYTHVKNFNGLQNIGNTCYMNSILQIFIRIHRLYEYLWGIEGTLLNQDSTIKQLINFQREYAEKEEIIHPNKMQSQFETLDPKRVI